MRETDVRIFIIDNDHSVCKSLARLLHTSGYVVETFTAGHDFLAREYYQGIGCIILDIRMPGIDGMELQAMLKKEGNKLPIVFLTGHGDIPLSVRAMQGGAVDFLTKPVDADVLLTAVDQAVADYKLFIQDVARLEPARVHLKQLTRREYEVMCLVLSGARNRNISAYLGIAEKTVKAHRAKIMEKMEVSSPVELGRLCTLLEIEPTEIPKY